MNSMSINGTVAVTDKEAIIDTGDIFISSNNDTITKIYNNVPDSSPFTPDLWSGTHVARLMLEWLLIYMQMTVPCDTDIRLTVTLGGNSFDIPAFGLGIGSGPLTLTDSPGRCLGPFAVRDDPSRKQSLLYCFTHYTHLEQHSFTLVPSSYNVFTPSSTYKIGESDLPRFEHGGEKKRIGTINELMTL